MHLFFIIKQFANLICLLYIHVLLHAHILSSLFQYDTLVKQCIQDLINSGDVGSKVTTFMAIATAKQGIMFVKYRSILFNHPFLFMSIIKQTFKYFFIVIIQHEPELLEEFGGKIKLNVSWAKSFLKRIDGKTITSNPATTEKSNESLTENIP